MERRMSDNNRRNSTDRRVFDAGPPTGMKERRISVERRQPCVCPLDFSDWAQARANYVIRSSPRL